MKTSVLVFAAHPDDEVLGCGGTLAKLADQGATIHVVFMADGVLSRGANDDVKLELKARQVAARRACNMLGVKSVSFGDFPDNRMDSIGLLDIIKVVESEINIHQPNMVFTHHIGDLNIDHHCVHKAVVTACRPQCGCPVKTLLFFEVPSSTEWQIPTSAPVFAPNWFIDISGTLERKLTALEVYDSELRAWPHPRSVKGVEHLAHWRGAIVGVESAEAFILGRNLS